MKMMYSFILRFVYLHRCVLHIKMMYHAVTANCTGPNVQLESKTLIFLLLAIEYSDYKLDIQTTMLLTFPHEIFLLRHKWL